jgi:hypothetical protein
MGDAGMHGIIQAGAVAAAITAIIGLVYALWRIGKTIHDFLEPLHDLVQHELRPNGGSSMKDEIRAVRDWQERHDAKHDADTDELYELLARHGIDRRRAP